MANTKKVFFFGERERETERDSLPQPLVMQLQPSSSQRCITQDLRTLSSLSGCHLLPPPKMELDCSPFSESEVAQVIKRMKPQSAPSPFVRIGYAIFKKCPSLLPVLVQLFNICWSQSIIPSEWKCAAIKLIPKGSATEDATNPANFRPVALYWQVIHYPPQESLAEVHGI